MDTAKSIKIGGYWATPTKLIGYHYATISGDTLNLVTCNNYVYSPFGKTKKKVDFKSLLLRKFTVADKTITDSLGSVDLNILKYKSSKLVFFLGDDDPLTHSTIVKGEIYDNDVELLYGIKVGMSEEEFYKKIFNYFPGELKSKYSVMSLHACVDGITHVYSFKNGIVNSIKFSNHYLFKVDY